MESTDPSNAGAPASPAKSSNNAAGGEGPPAGAKKDVRLGWWRGFFRPVLYTIVVFFIIRASIIDWNDVPTGSMKPTILDGDRIFVNKLAYGLSLPIPFTNIVVAHWGGPKAGEIVVFLSPADGVRLVKRVVAVPGDVVEVKNNVLYVNGEAMKYEPLDAEMDARIPASERSKVYIQAETIGGHKHPVMTANMDLLNPKELQIQQFVKKNFGPETVAEGKYFMMGDNRDQSNDSRYIGQVPRDNILGKAVGLFWSLDRDNGFMPRWSRFFRSLP